MDKAALVDAVNYMIEAKEYTATIRDVTLSIRDWDEKRVIYVGEKECLNALVQLGVEDHVKFQRVVELIESRRKSGPTLKRTEYQAEYMAQRRARLAKVYEIEGMVRGKALSPDEKRAAEKRVHASWAERKDQFIADQGAVTWDDKLAATALFWEQIDRELAEQLEAARSHPIVQRKVKRVVKPDYEPKTEFGRKIREAVRR